MKAKNGQNPEKDKTSETKTSNNNDNKNHSITIEESPSIKILHGSVSSKWQNSWKEPRATHTLSNKMDSC